MLRSLLLSALFCGGSDALVVPTRLPAARSAQRSAALDGPALDGSTLALCRKPRTSKVVMDDLMNQVIGGVLLFGGAAAGAAGIYFIEQQGERTNERGGLSEETRSKMAGMFMEDEEMASDYSSTIAKMEAALAKAEGRELSEELSEEEKKKIDAETLSDGWDD